MAPRPRYSKSKLEKYGLQSMGQLLVFRDLKYSQICIWIEITAKLKSEAVQMLATK